MGRSDLTCFAKCHVPGRLPSFFPTYGRVSNKGRVRVNIRSWVPSWVRVRLTLFTSLSLPSVACCNSDFARSVDIDFNLGKEELEVE